MGTETMEAHVKEATEMKEAAEVAKGIAEKKALEAKEAVKREVSDHKKEVLKDLKDDNPDSVANLKKRVESSEKRVESLQMWMWIGGGTLAFLAVVLLIAAIYACIQSEGKPHRRHGKQ